MNHPDYDNRTSLAILKSIDKELKKLNQQFQSFNILITELKASISKNRNEAKK